MSTILLRNALILPMDGGPDKIYGDLWLEDGKIREILPAGGGQAARQIPENAARQETGCPGTGACAGQAGTAGVPAGAEQAGAAGVPAGAGQAGTAGVPAGAGQAAAGYPAGAEQIDCTGCTVIPGLIDSHVHYDESYMGDFFLASGVTSVRNMRGFEGHARWRDEILAGRRRGPYLYSSGPVYDGEDPTIPDNDNVILHTEEDVEKAIRYTKGNGFLWMKTYPSIEPELYQYLLKRCQEEGLPVCGHMTKRMDHRYLADNGYVCCEHTSSLPADPDTIRYLARRGMWLCPTHVVCETLPDYVWNGKQLDSVPHYRDLPEYVREIWEEQNRVIIANYRELNVHPDFQTIIDRATTFLGVSHRVMAGTDCAYPGVVPGFSMAEELERLVKVYGLTNYEALCAATCYPAQFMGIQDQKGSLAPGMDADLVVLGGNPLEDIGKIREIKWVFQGRNHWDSEALRQFLTAAGDRKKEEVEFITGADGEPLG